MQAASQLTRTELSKVLALTVVPVLLTRVLGIGAAASGATANVADLDPAYVRFGMYALANWIVLAVLVWMVGTRRLRALGVRLRLSVGRFGWAVVAFMVGLLVYQGTAFLAAALGLPALAGMDYAAPGAFELVLLVVFVVITAPVSEEILFRVVWIGGLGAHIPKWSAAALSILVFAAIHYPYFGAGGVLFVTAWALLPSWLFIKFGDVTAPLLLHVLNNIFAYILVPLYLR